MESARRHGVVVSYDLNYRTSLWKSNGGSKKAQAVQLRTVRLADIVFWQRKRIFSGSGLLRSSIDENFSVLDSSSFKKMIGEVVKEYPNLKIIASTLRTVHSASRNDWGACAIPEAISTKQLSVSTWRFLTGSEGAIHLRRG